MRVGFSQNKKMPYPVEKFFQCPYCWQTISMLLDTGAQKQEMVEDCEVCCRPIQVLYEVDAEGDVIGFQASRAQNH